MISDRSRRGSEASRATPLERVDECKRGELRPLVLLATPVDLEPRDALIRASAVRDALGGSLTIARFLRRAGDPAERHDANAARHEAKVVATTLHWCNSVLDGECPDDVLIFRGESFVSALVCAARVVNASILVLPHTKSGRLAREIVRRTRIPLLIARRLRGRQRSVVAATDFTDRRYPVLTQGLRIGRGWVAPTIFVHNVVDRMNEGTVDRDHPRAEASRIIPDTIERFSDRISEFEEVDRALRVRCRRVVVRRRTTVGAIFEVAEREGADLIVVGTHTSPGHATGNEHSSVAAAVVGRAASSVLVVPVSGAEPPSGDTRPSDRTE